MEDTANPNKRAKEEDHQGDEDERELPVGCLRLLDRRVIILTAVGHET